MLSIVDLLITMLPAVFSMQQSAYFPTLGLAYNVGFGSSRYTRTPYGCVLGRGIKLRAFNPLTPTAAICHMGTAIKHPVPDRQSARMSKITNDETRSGTECFIQYDARDKFLSVAMGE